MTPIGIDIFFIFKPFGLCHLSKITFTGSFNLIISIIVTITILRLVYFAQDTIVEKFPSSKIYIDYLFESIRNIKDIIHYLPSDLLVKMDRASMNVSLETRAPFLDYRVAEMAWSSPLDFKIKKSGYSHKTKWALKEILQRSVPKEIIERPKAGFAMPIGSWLKGPLRNWADELLDPSLISECRYLDSKKVRELWHDHLDGITDNTSKIWTVLMWQAWVNEWIE